MKKLLALVICLSMLVSLVVVAQAENVSYVENFNDEEVSTTVIGSGVNYRAESPIFGPSFYPTNSNAEIAADGYKGNCFKIASLGGRWYQLGTEKFPCDAVTPAYVNFMLRVDNDADGTAVFQIKLNGTTNFIYIQPINGVPSINFSKTEKALPYVTGEWYNFSLKFTPGRVDVKVTDKDGNYGQGYRADSYVTGDDYLDFKGANTADAAIAGTGISLDEFYVYYGDDYSVGLDAESLPEDSGSVSRLPEFDFTLDAPADLANAVVSITDETGAPVSQAYTTTKKFGTAVSVKFTEMLPKGEDYTVTLSGIKNLAGVAQENVVYNFTTEQAHTFNLEEKTRSDVSGKTQVDVTLGNTLGYPSTPVKVMGVVYENGKMTSLEYKTGSVDANGVLSVVFDTIAPTQNFSLLVFDDANTLIPVIEAISFE